MGSRDPPARKQAGGGRHPLDSTELLVEFLVEFGLRRYTVPSETRDSLLLKFVNTELKAADHAVITPIQLIVATDRSRIDQSLPRNTIDATTQCIEGIDNAKKTGALNGHLDVGKYEAQHHDHAARFKAQEKVMQQLQSKLQSI